jgi:putative ABC transport system ATP-binding protein
MNYALETQAVTKTYSAGTGTEVRAVDAVSAAVRPGEFVALVGPSGSGKTTLLAMLAGLLAPSSGSIIINGRDMSRMSDAERTAFRRREIGFTFQANNLVPYLTALENVELMLRMNGMQSRTSRERARDLLVRLGLGERLHNLPRQLSGGQQQRVAIARALIHNPSAVLADEPTAALDSERAFQVVETFARLIHEEGKAGIMVTHDLRLARFVDKVWHMQDGKLVHIVDDRRRLESLDANAFSMTEQQLARAA